MSPVLGARLREERVRSGRNQADFAKLAGVSRNSQTEYETGKTAPNTDYLQRLADHGVDATYILTGVRQELAVEGWAAELLDLATRLDQPARDALLFIVRRMVNDAHAAP
ncbi:MULTISPECIES: helix-turn-helix domain-containing protein [Sphingomonas]|uniref:Helix-turn-helix transcriptional regulator n=1 Tax=Sphingomonas molluscorum TaxID=418184 RepID=A0ABU8Q7M2_9SPHN|nr:helix-turn-helix transcriptional regulator [Sphingomonas sp. JUb134]MBM7407082.1 transcriptional regulator with XRE-family HTH domain [Sphingomonas sp. JUb134]